MSLFTAQCDSDTAGNPEVTVQFGTFLKIKSHSSFTLPLELTCACSPGRRRPSHCRTDHSGLGNGGSTCEETDSIHNTLLMQMRIWRSRWASMCFATGHFGEADVWLFRIQIQFFRFKPRASECCLSLALYSKCNISLTWFILGLLFTWKCVLYSILDFISSPYHNPHPVLSSHTFIRKRKLQHYETTVTPSAMWTPPATQ